MAISGVPKCLTTVERKKLRGEESEGVDIEAYLENSVEAIGLPHPAVLLARLLRPDPHLLLKGTRPSALPWPLEAIKE